jgi:hypothetical protein
LLRLDADRRRLRVYPYLKLEERRFSRVRGEQLLEISFDSLEAVAVVLVKIRTGRRKRSTRANLWLLLADGRLEPILAETEPELAQQIQAWLCERTGAQPTETLERARRAPG